MTTQIEKKQIQQIALYSFLTALPVSAGASLIVNGDTVQWAKLQNLLGAEDVHAQITYEGPGVWTNDPAQRFSVTNPAPVVMPTVVSDSGDSGDSG